MIRSEIFVKSYKIVSFVSFYPFMHMIYLDFSTNKYYNELENNQRLKIIGFTKEWGYVYI